MDPALPPDLPREWLIFFSGGLRASWWDCFTEPGWRHVCAAAYYPSAGHWVFYDVSRRGTDIVLLAGEDANYRLGCLVAVSSAILRMRSRKDRTASPAVFYCTSAITALLGVRCRPVTPRGLYRQLLRMGAEPVEVPIERDCQPLQDAEAAGRGSEGGGDAQRGGAALRAR